MTHVPGSSEQTALQGAVETALHGTGHAWLERVAVAISGGVVTLQGQVPSYYLKQMAQVTVMVVPGVDIVPNELEVIRGS